MKRLKNMLVLLEIGCGFVFVLFLISYHLTHHSNNFYRIFPPHPVRFSAQKDIKLNSYYISGATGSRIYLGNYTTAFHLLDLNYSLSDTQSVKIIFDNEIRLHAAVTKISIDSPFFFVSDGIHPSLFKGKLNDWHAVKFMFDSAYFVEAVHLNSGAAILRSVTSHSHEYVFAKETQTVPHLQFFPGILTKQSEGLFSTDGKMNYNAKSGQLVYVYKSRNQFLNMDTALRIMYKGKTIDTNTTARASVSFVAAEHSYKLSSPELTVNKNSCMSDKYLFIHSGLIANNENEKSFKHASVIDVYDLKQGIYQFSFYLFDQYNEKMSSFAVYGNTLFAIFDHYIQAFTLNEKYFR